MKRLLSALVLLPLLAACGPITPAPDYTVGVAPTADGSHMVALAPDCPSWSSNDINFFDNQPLPQFGCANARNLALMVDQPSDLLTGRPSGNPSPVTTAGTILRYNNNQTRGLVALSVSPDSAVDATTAPVSASALTGETPPAAQGK